MAKKIGLIAGSLRKESFSKKVAQNVMDMVPEGFECRLISLDDLPVYNQDFDDHGPVPERYQSFRKELAELDGIIVVTPEHNRTMPAVLKNAIDIGSRPKGSNSWAGLTGLVISNSPGNISGFAAHHHVRQSLGCLGVAIVPQPEVYLAGIAKALNEDGELIDDSMKRFLQKAVDAFVEWTNRFK